MCTRIYILITGTLTCTYVIHTVEECTDGEIRLANGTTYREGRVEICMNHRWGTVCSVEGTEDFAGVVCTQLGFPRTGNYMLLILVE